MQKEQLVIGVDIGTTSTKAVIFAINGDVKGVHHVEYPLYTPYPTWAEQDPEEIFEAVVKTISEVVSKSGASEEQIQCVSFSSAMHSLIGLDHSGRPITPSVTWADNRSSGYTEQIRREMNGHAIYLRTGTPLHPMAPLSKLLWFRQEQPDLFKNAMKWIGIKEYVFYRLFNRFIIDYSIASATGLFNLEKLQWDEGALDVAGIVEEQLSEPVNTTFKIYGLNREHAETMGLRQDTPFVVGASDGVLSNLGVDAIKPGILAATIGTSGAVRSVVNRPLADPKGRIFCYYLSENMWVIGGPINNGGVTLRWVRDEIAAAEVEVAKRLGVDPYDILSGIAEKVKAGADGLIFLPFMAGERAPYWNANSRGIFFGLGLHHKKEHLIRAVMEGVIYSLYSVSLALIEVSEEAKEIRATGGFSRSPLWRQIMADVFQQPVAIPVSYESSCLGAALLGMKSLGMIDSLEVVKDMVGTVNVHTPNPQHSEIYQELMSIYLGVYRSLTSQFDLIADFQKRMFKH